MRILKANLLNVALKAIGMQTLHWYSFSNRTQNDRGLWVNEYIDQGLVKGSWQPVDARTIKELGFDTKLQYHNFYVSKPINVFSRNEAPDYFIIEGRKHEVVGGSEWYAQNGWKGLLCVDAGVI